MKSLLFVGLATLGLAKLSNAACSGAYAQCGGNNFQGESCCVSGFQCVKHNEWYSSCQPGIESNSPSLNVPSSNNNNWNNNNASISQASPSFKFYSKCINPMEWAITFDDGPTEYADAILDLLKENNIKATFFVVGNLYMSTSNPEWARIIKRMDDEGHTIGNHTFNHKDLTELSADQIMSEMKQLEDAVYPIIGKKPVFMRPPYGSGNGNEIVMNTLQSAGYKAAITWNVDPMDYSNGGDISYAIQVINEAKGQPIITLNHLKYGGATKDGIIALIKAEIEAMIANGYTPVTMEKCLGFSAYK
ncbi:glycoside hydrolase/deacetylase [Piromyces finnis]|uniref:Glycoside hydrolase/deacetylase n=1 Tax=Piromyces finnis TaxID=1754191 RepID=A0A1Y1V2E4_9FUNG|nr:glycoside hydrolase/deacetylase [Piromyces finnis]|eukprot:ORX44473.1 glycoside hydrolase/deacetylase [Piromyces finnis]